VVAAAAPMFDHALVWASRVPATRQMCMATVKVCPATYARAWRARIGQQSVAASLTSLTRMGLLVGRVTGRVEACNRGMMT
jgi:hypothetical protein